MQGSPEDTTQYHRGYQEALAEVLKMARATSPQEAIIAVARHYLDRQITLSWPVSPHAAFWMREPRKDESRNGKETGCAEADERVPDLLEEEAG